MKRKNEKRVNKNERENSLLCSFAGIITSVLGFSGSFNNDSNSLNNIHEKITRF